MFGVRGETAKQVVGGGGGVLEPINQRCWQHGGKMKDMNHYCYTTGHILGAIVERRACSQELDD